MGALDYLTNLCTLSSEKKSRLLVRRRRRPLQTVELKVKMDCDGCERRVKHAAHSIRGVTSVEVNRKQSPVTVTGFIDPNKVLKRIKNYTGKRVEIWPYVPYNIVSAPHGSQVYDKRAPSGFVRKILPAQDAPEDRYITMFSDDNPNSCSIM